ncbi:MAG: putative glutamine amidotransferase [Thermoleophilaceae bacterium]|nr:putative glutamine amidotransferase [Thermoleophilaceae bacterium]
MRPVIALTTSELRHPPPEEHIPHAEAGREEMVLGYGYLRALAAAGAAPVVMPPLDPEMVPSLLGGAAGVCLSGGPDIDPASYGAERRPETGPGDPAVDAFEIAVVREAERRGMPLLAICRGAQLLNVARGGDLYQDIPAEVGVTVDHRRDEPGDPVIWHEVVVEPGSLLARSLGVERLEANSFHHQAPHRLGDGLVAAAHAGDGVVEGIEVPGAEFELGVQWHPEAIADRPEQAALFRAFVEAARRYVASTASTAATAAGSQAAGSDGDPSTRTTGIA